MAKVIKNQVVKSSPVVENPFENMFGETNFNLPNDIKKDLEDKGLIGRWVNIKTLSNHGGYHPKGWAVYKRDQEKTPANNIWGADPDGYVRRGADLVLAVKPKSEVERHKNWLKHQADLHSVKNQKKQDREMLKAVIKEGGLQDHVSLTEGYED